VIPSTPARLIRGFTLLEVVITIVVFAIVATLGAALMSSGFRAYFLGREIAEDDAQARLAFERMARELRRARGTADLNIGVANQVSFTDIDGVAIAYRRNAGTSQLERSQTGVAGTYQALADNVSALTISYLRNDGVTSEAAGGNSALVYYITVQVTVSTQNASSTYRSTVKPTTF
jgi:prepilin-type N-terminal cleavage/methylation domain-containing protein